MRNYQFLQLGYVDLGMFINRNRYNVHSAHLGRCGIGAMCGYRYETDCPLLTFASCSVVGLYSTQSGVLALGTAAN